MSDRVSRWRSRSRRRGAVASGRAPSAPPRTAARRARRATAAANLECPVGVGGAPPATLAEFTVMPPSGGSDFYDVSNVDGSNVPLAIAPTPGTFDTTPPPGANVPYYCGSPGCTSATAARSRVLVGPPSTLPRRAAGPGPRPLRRLPQREPGVRGRSLEPHAGLRERGRPVRLHRRRPNGVSGSCYSARARARAAAVARAGRPPARARARTRLDPPSLPGKYAQVFKDACPTAYSFPYDDLTSTFTCLGSSEREHQLHHHVLPLSGRPHGRPGRAAC